MLELIMMSLLGAAYFVARDAEKKEERLNELKTKIFCYAVSHHMLYHEVVEKIENNELSLEEMDNDWKNNKERI